MNTRLWLAVGAFGLALLLLAPTLAPLPASMDRFAGDLANGTFRPFGPAGGSTLGKLGGALGGFTGNSAGNYVPGASDVPSAWLMDRDGTGGRVVIDYVFNPSPGAMKRLKAYDRVGVDGATLDVNDTRLRPIEPDRTLTYDMLVTGSFTVELHKGVAIPIFSVAPKGILTTTYTTTPALKGGLAFLKDGADTYYVQAQEDKRVLLNLTFLVDSAYYRFDPPDRSVASYPPGLVPDLGPTLEDSAKLVLARAGVRDRANVRDVLTHLTTYFRGFTEGDIPTPEEVDQLYLAISLAGHGCCRHRAFAFMVTAQAAGIPTRVVVNEAHAFPEVLFPDGHWHQVNLGGCGTYALNNPNEFPSLFDAAASPRVEANPEEGRAQQDVATFTNITQSPPQMVKGQSYFVNGTVQGANGRPVANAPIDLYLNLTKTAKGKLMGAGQSDQNGRFSIETRVPTDSPAQGYQLVASASPVSAGALRYAESWSDPPVDVFTPTRIVMPPFGAAAGFFANATGRLVDVGGNPVGSASIHWSAEGVPQPDAQTDATGLFTARFRFNDTGNRTLEFRYDGDEHHGPATLRAFVNVDVGSIQLPAAPPTLARGRNGVLGGDLAVSGGGLAGHAVRVSMSLVNGTRAAPAIPEARALTDADGHFVATVPVPKNAFPGAYDVRYAVEGMNVTAQGLARIAIPPTLTLDAPGRVARDASWVVTARVASDNGSALAGALVTLALDGNASGAQQLLTNATGYARFEVAGGAVAPGTHALRVAFEGDRVHAAAVETRAVEVMPPFWQLIPAWVWWTSAALALVAAVSAWALRPHGPVRRWVAKPRWRVALAFPEFEGIAPVAEPGGRVVVDARVLDQDGRARKARFLLVAEGARRKSRGRFEVPTPAEGMLELEVRPRGFARWMAPPAHARVPVSSYRRAVEEGFVALRGVAQMPEAATPGDLVAHLAPRFSRAQLDELERAARLFELADYSETDVDRAFYHEFARARAAVERALEGGSAA